MFRAKLDIAIAGAGDQNHEHDVERGSQQVVPAKCTGDPVEGTANDGVGLFIEQDSENGEQQNQACGNEEHHMI